MPETAALVKLKTHLLSLARNERFQRLVFSGVFFLSTIVILGYLVFRERDLLFEYRWEFRAMPALTSFAIYTAALVMVIWIWGWMMNTLTKKIPFRIHFHNYAISNVTKRLPGTIWYIASRAHLYRSEAIDPKLTSLVSGVELVISTMSSILVSLVFSIALLREYRINFLASIVLLVLCGILLQPRSYTWLCRLLKVEAVALSYITLFRWLVVYSLFWVLCGTLLFMVGNIFTTIPLQYLGYFIGSFTMVTVLTIPVFFLPSNFGVTEVGLSLFLSRVMPAHIAVMIAIAFRLLVTLYDIVWAAIAWKLRSATQ